MLLLLKLLLTVPVTALLLWPLYSDAPAAGVFAELALFGRTGALIIAALFLLLVFGYCRDLQRLMAAIAPAHRTATPRSVWLMFLLPYNFVEDFFIIAHVARSLRNEAGRNPALAALKHFGWWTGMGWCAAQILSLIPHEIGSLGGLLALPLWIVHWRFVRHARKLLAADQ